MSWDAIGAFAELVGALGVLLSLLYLASQIRQNTKALRGTTVDAVTTHQRDELRWYGELSALFEKADNDPDSVTSDEWGQLHSWIVAAMTSRQNDYFQYRHGLLDEEIWQSDRQIIRQYFRRPWVQRWWQKTEQKQVFSKKYQDVISNILAETDA